MCVYVCGVEKERREGGRLTATVASTSNVDFGRGHFFFGSVTNHSLKVLPVSSGFFSSSAS